MKLAYRRPVTFINSENKRVSFGSQSCFFEPEFIRIALYGVTHHVLPSMIYDVFICDDYHPLFLVV